MFKTSTQQIITLETKEFVPWIELLEIFTNDRRMKKMYITVLIKEQTDVYLLF